MQDRVRQSESLRLIQAGGAARDPMQRPRTRTVAVVSGKGGTGKTTLVTNLALSLRERGHRVLLVDGDWGMANVDLMLGVTPRYTLHDVVLGDRKPREILLETEDGIHLMPGASGVEEMVNLDDLSCERLLCSIADVEEGMDLILLDTPSGINRTATHLARAADEIIVVTTPEPAAYTDAYATLKVLSRFRHPGTPWIAVNRVRDAGEALGIAERIRSVSRGFLAVDPGYLGYVFEDPCIRSSSIKQRPFLKLYPDAPGAGCITRLAARLMAPSEPEPRDADDSDDYRRVVNLEDTPA